MMNNRNVSVALSTGAVALLIFLALAASSTHEESPGVIDRMLAGKGDGLGPLFPLRTIDYVGLTATIVGLMLCAGGGIGGGGLLVPIYIVVMQYPVKHAVSLSNVTVFGGAVANTVLNVQKRHPIVDRPLIDWNLLAVMEPPAMIGALVGAVVIQYLPDVLVIALLVLLLGFVTSKTLKKAHELHDRETAAHQKSKETAALISNKPAAQNTKTTSTSYGTNSEDHDQTAAEKGYSSELKELLEKESRVPWKRIAQISALFLCVIIVNIVEGSGAFSCGSIGFIGLQVTNLIVIVLFAIFIHRDMVNETIAKQALSYEFVDGDVVWDHANTWKYAIICVIAGLCAGLFGIGGGMIFAPLMLEMGIHPTVSSATSATMILFTSFTATTSFMVYGQLNYLYAGIFGSVGFVATVIGQLMMQAILAKYNRNSYIAYCIALVVGISAVCMTFESVISLVQGHTQRAGGMCPT